MKTDHQLALALQGGGAHGAITWGILDRLLEEDLPLRAFSGTSAGAVNAVLLAHGLQQGGRSAAQALLEGFWKAVSDSARRYFFRPSYWDAFFGKGNMEASPSYLWMEMSSLFLSPTQFNPLGLNPLRDILEEMIDFGELRRCSDADVFVCATNVRRGRAKVFRLAEISVDAVLASACLPQLFHTVEIEGEAYWDGGFMGNPPLFPLVEETECSDIVIVQINPVNIGETPSSPYEIRDRINELSFNSSLLLELQKLDLFRRLHEAGVDCQGRYRPFFLHNINPEEDVQNLKLSSKFNAEWSFLQELKAIGRDHAGRWLERHAEQLGTASTCDLDYAVL